MNFYFFPSQLQSSQSFNKNCTLVKLQDDHGNIPQHIPESHIRKHKKKEEIVTSCFHFATGLNAWNWLPMNMTTISGY